LAISIITEVWKKAPRDIKNTTLLVLLKLADSASEDYRTTFIGVDRIAREVRASKKTVYNALRTLEDRGIIETIIDETPPGPYESAVRYITPADTWTELTEPDEDDELGCVPTEEKISSVVMSGDGSCDVSTPERVPTREKISPKPSYIDSYISLSYPPSGDNSVAPGARQGRKRRKKKKAKGTGHDPYNPVENHPDLMDLVVREEPEPEPETQHRFQIPDRDSSQGLAYYFTFRLGPVLGKLGQMDLANRTALARAFSRWLKSGLSPDYIRKMIDAYAKTPGYQADGVTPWKDFLAKRALLHKHVERAERERLMDDPAGYEDLKSQHAPWITENGEFDEEAWMASVMDEVRRKAR